jgi:hypothetical protein
MLYIEWLGRAKRVVRFALLVTPRPGSPASRLRNMDRFGVVNLLRQFRPFPRTVPGSVAGARTEGGNGAIGAISTLA